MRVNDNVYAFRRDARRGAAPDGERARDDAVAGAVPAVPARVDLWSLPPACHCPLIGSCLGTQSVRELLDELFSGRSDLEDFELHAGVVRECGTRNKVSERVQQALDRRYDASLQAVADAADAAELGAHWRAAAASGDVAGAFWAIVSHGRCDEATMERLLRDMHMIQHHAAAALHVQLGAAEALAAENVRLRAELAAKTRQCEQLGNAVVEPYVPARRPAPRRGGFLASVLRQWPGTASPR